jgi:hypothetical protein
VTTTKTTRWSVLFQAADLEAAQRHAQERMVGRVVGRHRVSFARVEQAVMVAGPEGKYDDRPWFMVTTTAETITPEV